MRVSPRCMGTKRKLHTHQLKQVHQMSAPRSTCLGHIARAQGPLRALKIHRMHPKPIHTSPPSAARTLARALRSCLQPHSPGAARTCVCNSAVHARKGTAHMPTPRALFSLHVFCVLHSALHAEFVITAPHVLP